MAYINQNTPLTEDTKTSIEVLRAKCSNAFLTLYYGGSITNPNQKLIINAKCQSKELVKMIDSSMGAHKKNAIFAQISSYRDLKTIKKFYEFLSITDVSNAFYAVCCRDNLPIIEWFDNTFTCTPYYYIGLVNCCNTNNLTIAKWLWERSNHTLDIHTYNDRCLKNACWYGSRKIVEWLIEIGHSSKVDLAVLVHLYDSKMTDLLPFFLADTVKTITEEEITSTVSNSIIAYNYDKAKWLIDISPIKPNIRNSYGDKYFKREAKVGNIKAITEFFLPSCSDYYAKIVDNKIIRWGIGKDNGALAELEYNEYDKALDFLGIKLGISIAFEKTDFTLS